MSKMRLAPLALIVVTTGLCVLAGRIQAQTPDFSKYLTVADVEKASGVKNVKMEVSAGTKSTELLSLLAIVMFTDASGTPILTVTFEKPGIFHMDKTHAIVGLGDEAYTDPTRGSVVFRKGDRGVIVGAAGNPTTGPKPLLTM